MAPQSSGTAAIEFVGDILPPTAATPSPRKSTMKILLRIPDDVIDAYEAQCAQAGSGQLSLEELMIAQLERFKGVRVTDRVLVVGTKARERLEEILSGGDLSSDANLVEKVQNLADIKIQDVRVDWTPAQLAELKRYAARNDITVTEAIRRNVQQISAQFFWSVG